MSFFKKIKEWTIKNKGLVTGGMISTIKLLVLNRILKHPICDQAGHVLFSTGCE